MLLEKHLCVFLSFSPPPYHSTAAQICRLQNGRTVELTPSKIVLTKTEHLSFMMGGFTAGLLCQAAFKFIFTFDVETHHLLFRKAASCIYCILHNTLYV